MNFKVFILFLISFTSFIYGDYSKNDEVRTFIELMVKNHDFDKNQLIKVFEDAEKRQNIIDSMNRPAEKKFSWADYKSRLISPMRIKNGVDFLMQHLPDLERAEEAFGVPKEIITSIIGIESSYGLIKGRERVIDALSTLAFDYPRRSKFFKKQLEEFFILSKEEGFNPLIPKGSYAGAMGFGQFIPSSYRAYAIDFDGDNLRDIIFNPVDSIGSVANYLSKHGWERDGNIAEEISRKQTTSDFETSLKLKPLSSLGISSNLKFEKDKKYLQINLENKEFWIGHKNLYVLSRYNRSSFYIMAVYLLSKEIDYAFKVRI